MCASVVSTGRVSCADERVRKVGGARWLASRDDCPMVERRGIVVGAALIGLVVWVVGLKGLSNVAESTCLADSDGRPSYGAYQTSATLWPPSFECHLFGNSAEPIVVQHPLEAIVAFGWVVLVPVLYAFATLALTLRWVRARRGVSSSGSWGSLDR